MRPAKVKPSLLDSLAVLLPGKPRPLQEMESLMRNPDFEAGMPADRISRDPGVLAALFKRCTIGIAASAPDEYIDGVHDRQVSLAM